MDAARTESGTAVGGSLAANGSDGAAALVLPPIRPMHQDIAPHVEAWEYFVALTKWSTIGIIVILGLLALFLL